MLPVRGFGAVFAVLTHLVIVENTESFIDAAFAAYIFRVEDVAQFLGCKAVEVGEDGIQLGLSNGRRCSLWM